MFRNRRRDEYEIWERKSHSYILLSSRRETTNQQIKIKIKYRLASRHHDWFHNAYFRECFFFSRTSILPRRSMIYRYIILKTHPGKSCLKQNNIIICRTVHATQDHFKLRLSCVGLNSWNKLCTNLYAV